jgi:ribonuclease HI
MLRNLSLNSNQIFRALSLSKAREALTLVSELTLSCDAPIFGTADGRCTQAGIVGESAWSPVKTGRRRDKEKRRRHHRKSSDVRALAILPNHLVEQFRGRIWLFTDASVRTRGGLAAVLHHPQEAAPRIRSDAVARGPSHALELRAALFGLEHAQRQYPDEPLVLFSDSQGAVERLTRAKQEGLSQDLELESMMKSSGLSELLSRADFQWIKGHGKCGGNAMADQHARAAAA